MEYDILYLRKKLKTVNLDLPLIIDSICALLKETKKEKKGNRRST